MNRLVAQDWAELIPHRGAMSLLDDVVTWDAQRIHARSESHRAASHPLRSAGGLHVVHLVEYAAQASAVHGALTAIGAGHAPPRGGRLVSLRDVEFGEHEYVQAHGCLDIHADRLMGDHSSAHYAFSVQSSGTLLVAGRMAVMYAASD